MTEIVPTPGSVGNGLPQLGFGDIEIEGMLDRVREVALFSNLAFPAAITLDDEGHVVASHEFFDGAKSLGRLLGGQPALLNRESVRNPWQRHVPTITGNSRMVMRTVRPRPTNPMLGIVTIRMLQGFELMQLMGWDLTEYASLDALPRGALNCSLLSSLAGNAFSTFMCVPFSMAILAVVGSSKPEPESVRSPVTPRPKGCSGNSADDESPM